MQERSSGNGESSRTTTETGVGAKRPYSPPTLRVYGAVAQLTMTGGGSIADALAMMMVAPSDRRLKRDVVRIGDHPLGIGIYLFSYRDSPDVRHFGVMADEVEGVLPGAVSMGPDGYKRVDYHQLGVHPTR